MTFPLSFDSPYIGKVILTEDGEWLIFAVFRNSFLLYGLSPPGEMRGVLISEIETHVVCDYDPKGQPLKELLKTFLPRVVSFFFVCIAREMVTDPILQSYIKAEILRRENSGC